MEYIFGKNDIKDGLSCFQNGFRKMRGIFANRNYIQQKEGFFFYKYIEISETTFKKSVSILLLKEFH